MKLCIQRVKSASVTVEGRVTGEISSKGLVCLLGKMILPDRNFDSFWRASLHLVILFHAKMRNHLFSLTYFVTHPAIFSKRCDISQVLEMKMERRRWT